MKKTNLIVILTTLVLLFSCKESQEKKQELIDKAVEQTLINEIPLESDIYFRKAISSLGDEDRQIASKEILQGVDALQKEGKDVSGLYKVNLNLAIEQLRAIAKTLNDNNDVMEETLKEAIANAEINIAHQYLATDAVYVLTPKSKVQDLNLHRAFEVNLKNLDAGTSKLKDDAKEEGEKLKAKGEKLKADYEAWKIRVEQYHNKVQEHFKKHQPEYGYEIDWGEYPG